MNDKLLTRDLFREGVFERDRYKCVICSEDAKDAHHILERRLFEDGGYYLSNGASLCQNCHIKAEETTISCDQIREKAGITTIVLPEHLYKDNNYDKWGNIILPNQTRIKGELFYDESVQKILKQGNVLDSFVKYMKYPRTYHMPESTLGKDDKMLPNDDQFKGKDVIVSLKMDGENCLDSETIIFTEDGEKTIKEICDTKYSGKVISYNEITNEFEFKQIINHSIIDPCEKDEWYEIELINGIKLILTSNHYVYLPLLSIYRKVSDLNEDDEILFLQ